LLRKSVAREANDAAQVKREKPILVVLGNPPYSGHSANRSVIEQVEYGNGRKRTRRTLTWIGQLMEDYKQVDGQPLQEKNPKWLQDDYVKFIRWGQWRIERTGEGILAFITNHAYLDNPTFRGMRASLLQTFDRLYILNLHGNARRKETAPDGSPDENVFDIQQGVAIVIAMKHASRLDEPDPTAPSRNPARKSWRPARKSGTRLKNPEPGSKILASGSKIRNPARKSWRPARKSGTRLKNPKPLSRGRTLVWRRACFTMTCGGGVRRSMRFWRRTGWTISSGRP